MSAREHVCWILMKNVMRGLDIRSCIALHVALLGDELC